MEKGRRLLGILIIILSIVSLITWEKWGKFKLISDTILVVQENVQPGTLIEEKMLTEKKMQIDESDCIKETDKYKIIGKEATGFIHKGVPLFEEYFSDSESDPSYENDRFLITVEDSWMLGMPSGIKRGDEVILLHGKNVVISAKVSQVGTDGKSFGIIVNTADAMKLSELVYQGEKLVAAYN